MDFFQLLHVPQVIFGIGLVIFVHEAGHFIAAKLCGVRVEIFSLGFGPRIFGWRRGHTIYQVAAVPLGGFVKMAGDEVDRSGRTGPPEDWELAGKSVSQRFFIYSGGVLMNVLFALVAFPLLLLSGLPSTSPLVGEPITGSPAWQANFPAGSTVLEVNGREVFDYIHIPSEVANSGKQPTTFKILAPGDSAPREITLTPEYVENPGIYQVGLPPAPDPELRLEVREDGPAFAAGLRTGDRLLDVPGQEPELSVTRQLSFALRDRSPVRLTVLRDSDDGGALQQLELEVAPQVTDSESSKRIGVGLAYGHLAHMRDTSLARQSGLQVDDRLLSIDGVPVLERSDTLDGLLAAAERGAGAEIVVQRGSSQLDLTLPVLTRTEAFALESDLDVAADFDSVRVSALAGGAAEAAGLQDGDIVLSIQGVRVESWEEFQGAARVASGSGDPIELEVLRRGADDSRAVTLSLVPRPAQVVDYGFDFRQAEYVYQAATVGEAVTVGVTASWRFLVDTARTLRRMLSAEVSTDNLGGIITIGVVSHSFAEQGWAKLFFFLCLLSMNLAVLNVLPIPVLDGGHLFFLLVEGIKGSPVSEKTLGYSQVIGLVLILSLMVYVTYNDIARWFLTG